VTGHVEDIVGADVVLFLDAVAGILLAWARLGPTPETHAIFYHEGQQALLFFRGVWNDRFNDSDSDVTSEDVRNHGRSITSLTQSHYGAGVITIEVLARPAGYLYNMLGHPFHTPDTTRQTAPTKISSLSSGIERPRRLSWQATQHSSATSCSSSRLLSHA
jgi:hypothetical protein